MSGCANKEKQLVGKWKFKSLDVPAAQQSNPMIGMIKSMLASSTIEIKPDKKFVLTMVVPIEGTWALTDSKVTMTPTSVQGMSIDQVKSQAQAQGGQSGMMAKGAGNPLDGTLSDDGKTLTVSGSGQQGSMVFEKEAS